MEEEYWGQRYQPSKDPEVGKITVNLRNRQKVNMTDSGLQAEWKEL